MGKELEIRTYRAINRQKEFYGVLTGYTDDTVTICTEEDEELTFQKNEIALIRLAFDFQAFEEQEEKKKWLKPAKTAKTLTAENYWKH